jgi:hypothetical protein
MPSDRLRTRYDKDSNEVLLQIDNVRPEDAGQYQVVATNPAGKDSTGGSLSVKLDQPRAEDKRPQEQERRPVEIISSPDQSDEVPQEMRPPRVTVPLKDSDVEESMPVILTTKIEAGQPTALVRTFPNLR